MDDVNAALVQKILDLAKGKRDADVEQDRSPDHRR